MKILNYGFKSLTYVSCDRSQLTKDRIVILQLSVCRSKAHNKFVNKGGFI